MRIISGKLRGRRLVAFSAKHIRPTTDRVKETIFNKLQAELPGARVLDLFSGTGNLAIESYSRGASYIEAVEKSPKSVKIIKKNLEEFQIVGEINVITSDVLKYLKGYVGEAFDIIIIDPPFTQKLSHSILSAIGSSKALSNDSLVVIESAMSEQVEDEYQNLKFLDRKNYGDKKLTFYQGELL